MHNADSYTFMLLSEHLLNKNSYEKAFLMGSPQIHNTLDTCGLGWTSLCHSNCRTYSLRVFCTFDPASSSFPARNKCSDGKCIVRSFLFKNSHFKYTEVPFPHVILLLCQTCVCMFRHTYGAINWSVLNWFMVKCQSMRHVKDVKVRRCRHVPKFRYVFPPFWPDMDILAVSR